MNYFSEKETKCKCGCGMNVSHQLIEKLNQAREIAGIPFIITSGARCVKHNAKVGGSKTSSHTKGLAVDIACTTSRQRFLIIEALLLSGFTRIGINPEKGFIHVDVDDEKPQEVIFEY